MIKNIYNLGDAALYCDFGDTVNKETNLKVINYFNDIREKNITGIKNIAPSYNCLLYTSPSQRDQRGSRLQGWS